MQAWNPKNRDCCKCFLGINVVVFIYKAMFDLWSTAFLNSAMNLYPTSSIIYLKEVLPFAVYYP